MRRLHLSIVLGCLVFMLGWHSIAAQTTCNDTLANHVQRMELAFEEERWQDVIAEATCAISLSEPANQGTYYFYRGYAHEILKEYDSAEVDYLTVLETMPDADGAYNNLGNIYLARGDAEQARAAYEQAIAINANNDTAYYNLGILDYQNGNYQQAIDAWLALLERFPDASTAYISLALGQTYYFDLEDDQGLFYLKRYIEDNASETTALPLADATRNNLTMANGRVYALAFAGRAGDSFSASALVVTGTIDPFILLLDSQGNPIIADDDSGINFDAVINSYTLPTDGEYTLIVTHSSGGSQGTISLSYILGAERSADITTGTFVTYRLFLNRDAEVYTTQGDRLNLRAGPGLIFDVIARLERDTRVTLLNGPQKADGLNWWFIRTDAGQEGWAVERVDGEQTLQTALVVGEEAIVTTDGDRLNVRAAPGTSGERIGQIDNGSRVTILEGPQTMGNFRWWRVRTVDGVLEGWVIDRFEGFRQLVPAIERN